MLRKAWNKIFRASDEDEKPSRITQRTIHLDFTVNKQRKETFEDEVIIESTSSENEDEEEIPTIEHEDFEIIEDSKDAGGKRPLETDSEILTPRTSGVTEATKSEGLRREVGETIGTINRNSQMVIDRAAEKINQNTKIIERTPEAINQDSKVVERTARTTNQGTGRSATTNQNTKIVERTATTEIVGRTVATKIEERAANTNQNTKIIKEAPIYQNIVERKEAKPIVIYQNIPEHQEDKRNEKLSYKLGDVLEAIASYNPSTERELGFKTGDRIEIGDSNSKSNWRRATNLRTNESGYVHVNYLGGNLEAKPWYFGDISFYQARTLLEDGQSGTFLVYKRPYDQKIPYALLLRFNKQTKNYGVYREDNTYHISEGFYTKTLETLIKAYEQDQNLSLGLCTRLLQPCVKLDPTINDLSVDFKDKLEIARGDIKIGEAQGKGYSSEVYKGKWRNKDIAIKSLSGDFSKEDFEKEVLVLKKLKHKNIVQFYGISAQQKPFLIILEFMKIGDLATYLKRQALEEYQRIHIASQVADGMAYLAKEGVVHRDLAARNVLLQDKLTAKISDFGISRLTDNEDEVYMATTQRKLPIRWLAPECATDSRYSEQSDVWAFSILLMEIYTRQRPYKELNMAKPQDFLQRIKDGYRMAKPDNMPDDVFDLCTLCWNKQVKLRPKFKDISSFFHDFMIHRAQIIR